MTAVLLEPATGQVAEVEAVNRESTPDHSDHAVRLPNVETASTIEASPIETGWADDAPGNSAVTEKLQTVADPELADMPSFENLAAAKASSIRRSPDWARRAKFRVMLTDALAIYASVFAAFTLRWGIADIADLEPIQLNHNLAATALLLIAVWWAALGLATAWDVKIMGAGSDEYTRVWNVTFAVFGGIAIFAYLSGWSIGRSFIGIALPLGLLLLGFGRWVMRRHLVRERELGQSMSRALIIGSPATAEHFISRLARAPESGLNVVAACTPGTVAQQFETTAVRPVSGRIPIVTSGLTSVAFIEHSAPFCGEFESESQGRGFTPRLHTLDDVVPYVTTHDIDTVIVSGSDEVNPSVLKRLAWSLEPHNVDLILAPELTDVAATRMAIRNVAGLSLMHLAAPGYTSAQQRLKRASDLIGSIILIAIFTIPLAITALLIRVTSPGPVLFKQTRIGVDGVPFKVYKFRSMYADAESRLTEVLGGAEVGLFYKPKNDPRITPIGKFIRRFSIDELPQLFNVLFGTMSLVGPRPQIPAEVELYENGIERRLFVKPGITGLWQVSGRNNLSVGESLRLDLYYVENWSMTEDLLILGKTAKAVLGRDGAY